ncbi:MAG TPA: glycoside hydrolase domain-containing protein [Candidatus Methylomirabilis sp.]|nr:glycoside hydrolase domain-containing protein [Candidatus Methylomirabilis sp.]
MKVRLFFLLLAAAASSLIFLSSRAESPRKLQASEPSAFLGFDLNIFPGNTALPLLRKSFAFAGYWLSSPPGEKKNTWTGKRETVRSEGFGFLLLFRGRATSDLKNEADGAQKGTHDARAAAAAAKREGFPQHSIVFLDIEEGGRLPAAYHGYLKAWSEELSRGGYRPGAYCSGMIVDEGGGVTITTSDDIRAHAPSEDFVFFVFNYACPPSPGCVFPKTAPLPASSGISYAAIWQFAQSPRPKKFTAYCAPGYHADGNCYAPGDAKHAWFLDVDSASRADPSNGR